MGRLSKLCFVTVASALFVAASVTPARADIIVGFGLNNEGTDNVLLDPATNAFTVTGTFGTSNRVVNLHLRLVPASSAPTLRDRRP